MPVCCLRHHHVEVVEREKVVQTDRQTDQILSPSFPGGAKNEILRFSLAKVDTQKERKRNLIPARHGIYGIFVFIAQTIAWHIAFMVKVEELGPQDEHNQYQ